MMTDSKQIGHEIGCLSKKLSQTVDILNSYVNFIRSTCRLQLIKMQGPHEGRPLTMGDTRKHRYAKPES